MDNNKNGLAIAVSNVKGGIGKSLLTFELVYTTAINEPEKSIIIVNVDTQKTIEFRKNRREENNLKDYDNIFFDNCTAAALKYNLKVYKEKYDYVFIDLAANFHAGVLTSFVECELIYFVLNPSISSTEVMPALVEIMSDSIELRRSVCVYKSLYNRVSPLPHVAAAQVAESTTALAPYASIITPCGFSIADRAVYEKCAKTGESITERKIQKSDVSANKAKAEIAAFYEDFRKTVSQINRAGDSNE